MDINPGKSVFGALTRYFAPLSFQSITQAISYPLVAVVATQGQGGAANLAGLSQASGVMFLLSTLGAGLITTGMVYGGDRDGFRNYSRLNAAIALATVFLQTLVCFPGLGHWVFGTLIKLPPAIEKPALLGLLASIPVQYLFYMRNPYQVALYIHGATAQANYATVGRIVLTVILAPLFCVMGLIGPVWAVVCLTIPVGLETVISRQFAMPFLRAMPVLKSPPPTMRQLYFFTMPLSLGGFFLSLSGIIIGAFIARAASPEDMLPVYYLAAGLAGPVAFASTRLQAVIISFMEKVRRGTLFRFSVSAGMVLGFLPLLSLLPGAGEFYYVRVQHLDPALMPAIRTTVIALILFPVAVAFRSFCEGIAAGQRKPMAILAGQSVFLGSLVTVGACSLALGLSGNLIGPAALITANLSAAGIVYLSIAWERERGPAMPVVPVAGTGDQEL